MCPSAVWSNWKSNAHTWGARLAGGSPEPWSARAAGACGGVGGPADPPRARMRWTRSRFVPGKRSKKGDRRGSNDECENFLSARRPSVVASPHLLLRQRSRETSQMRVCNRSPITQRPRHLPSTRRPTRFIALPSSLRGEIRLGSNSRVANGNPTDTTRPTQSIARPFYQTCPEHRVQPGRAGRYPDAVRYRARRRLGSNGQQRRATDISESDRGAENSAETCQSAGALRDAPARSRTWIYRLGGGRLIHWTTRALPIGARSGSRKATAAHR
jgi:hypothetical protein